MREKSGTFSQKAALAFICCLILLVYFPIIGKITFSPDAYIIIPPLLQSSIADYIRMLSTFEVVDFQPVRDFTFFFDIYFFQNFKIATFTLTNILFWCFSCALIYRLVLRVNLSLSRMHAALLVAAFAVYPLFSQAVNWTMARKHLVAFSLMLLATHLFLDWMAGKKKWFYFYLAYVSAVLSHPIVVFWPCWALLHHKLFHRRKSNHELGIYTVLFITMIALLLTNYAYYVVLSPRLLDYYTQARPSFSLSRIFFNLGYYFREVIWPYHLSFTLNPDLSYSWPGFISIGIIGIFVWKKRNQSEVLSWFFFSLVPLPVFIGLTVYHQYLLISATGIFLAISVTLKEIKRPWIFVLGLTIIFWGSKTFSEASLWPIKGAISERNFKNAPSCRSAIEVINALSQLQKKMDIEALEYFEEKRCNTVYSKLPPAQKPKSIVAHSLFLYYRKDSLSEEKVLEYLLALGTIHYFPLLLYAVIMASHDNREGVRMATDYIFERTKGPVDDSGSLVLETLVPFCQRHQLANCLTLLSPKNSPQMPFF